MEWMLVGEGTFDSIKGKESEDLEKNVWCGKIVIVLKELEWWFHQVGSSEKGWNAAFICLLLDRGNGI